MDFGAGKREDAHRGVLPRVERLVKAVAARASADSSALDGYLPILEYLASRVPGAYRLLADLVLEAEDTPASKERAKNYLRRFLEVCGATERRWAWAQLAELCRVTDDVVGEVHALAEAALLPTMRPEDIGMLANQINNRIRDLRGHKVDEAWSPEVQLLIERVATAMERRNATLSATDCSRLAWLYLNTGNEGRARDVARIGIERDRENDHCQNLLRRLEA